MERSEDIRKVIDLLEEQELLKARFFAETERKFVFEETEEMDLELLDSEVCKNYHEMENALKRYLEIEDRLNRSYAKCYIRVFGYRFSVATGLEILHDLLGTPLRTHPIGVFLSMCSVSDKTAYAKQPRFFVDPMELEDDTVIEAVDSKVERFLIKLKYQIQKSNYENEA
ncbi:MAG: hypothetical protein ACI4HI_06235 [Lachnospiraceae bacterium]